MEDRNQKVVIFDDYVCEKNQENIKKNCARGALELFRNISITIIL